MKPNVYLQLARDEYDLRPKGRVYLSIIPNSTHHSVRKHQAFILKSEI